MRIDTAPLTGAIVGAHTALFEQFDPSSCIAAFDELSTEASYHEIPDSVGKSWTAILDQFGEPGFDAFQRLTLLRLIGDSTGRIAAGNFVNSIHTCFDKSLARIMGHIADTDFDKYRTPNDILFKDLGICRQKIFPAGAQVVEPDSGFHRSLIFRSGARQAFGVAALLLETGGNRHWYQIHTHLSELEDFNPEGWDACYLRLADMMEVNLNIRGMWGGSWFYDPALESISPRLAYLRKVPQENGAKVFYSNVEIKGGALSKSETRKKAYEIGDYLPKSYSLIWPRKSLLTWAMTKRAKDSAPINFVPS